jgi:hypothetical protein
MRSVVMRSGPRGSSRWCSESLRKRRKEGLLEQSVDGRASEAQWSTGMRSGLQR